MVFCFSSFGQKLEMTEIAQRVSAGLSHDQGAMKLLGSSTHEGGNERMISTSSDSSDRKVEPRAGQGVNITSGSVVNSVSGGTANTVLGGGTVNSPCTITGGNEAGTSGAYRVIVGGYDHVISSTGVGADVIGGGAHHRITGTSTHGTISGGSYCVISAGDYGSIGGGTNNAVTGSGATIAGGRTNAAAGQNSTVAGGVGNSALGPNDNVAGGINNLANGNASSVGGGNGNRVLGRNGYVGAGNGNVLGAEGTSYGDFGFIGGGLQNVLGTASNARFSSIPGGRECSVQHEYAAASGYHAVSRVPGGEVRASGSFAKPGDAQSSRLTLRRVTTDGTAMVLGWNGSAAPPTILTGTTYLLEGSVLARRTDQAGGNAAWRISALYVRDSGAARVVGATVAPLAVEGTASAWSVTLTTGGSTVNINATGASGHTVRWVGNVTLTEVGQ